jgi:hypothetical protein
MVRPLVLSLVCSYLCAASAPASTTEAAIVAAMNVGQEHDYSWTSSVEDDAGAYQIAGKTERNGYTTVTLPLVPEIRDRLGREADTRLEAIFKDTSKCVIRVGEQWKTLQELPKAKKAEEEVVAVPLRPMSTGPVGPDGLAVFPPIPWVPAPERQKAFSNARLAVSPPHEELALIVSGWSDLQLDHDAVTGWLSDTTARLLLAPDDGGSSVPLVAAGKFKLWLKDKLVTRYQLQLEAVMLVGRKKIMVHQNSDTNITDVGRTKIVVPDEARAKLGK